MSAPDDLVAEFDDLARIAVELRPQIEVLAFRYIAADRAFDEAAAPLDISDEGWSEFRKSFAGGAAEKVCVALLDMRTALERAV